MRKPKLSPDALAYFRAQGKRGGEARAANQSKKALSEIGRKGAAARWGKKPAPPPLRDPTP